MSDKKRFIEVYHQGGGFSQRIAVLVDTQTGVNYMTVANGYAGGLTPLLDANGKPIVTSRTYWEKEK